MEPEVMGMLATEARNDASAHLDELAAIDVVRLMNREDATVAAAVVAELPSIARAVEAIAGRLRGGGRLIYIGAGTSGRLGVLDAAECPPTFNTPPELVVGVIAGGERALTTAVEGIEDDLDAGKGDLRAIQVKATDAVVGITASGRTPYVLGAMQYAAERGALRIGLTCNQHTSLAADVDILIAPVTGAEVVTGSTRLKAGTAQKMVLNMLSTGSMTLLGKTFGNLMVDLRASNSKLRDRSIRIVQAATGVDADGAAARLAEADGEVKTAIVALLAGVTVDAARLRLTASGGGVRAALSGAPGPRGEDE